MSWVFNQSKSPIWFYDLKGWSRIDDTIHHVEVLGLWKQVKIAKIFFYDFPNSCFSNCISSMIRKIFITLSSTGFGSF